jgi:hypothetical protein
MCAVIAASFWGAMMRRAFRAAFCLIAGAVFALGMYRATAAEANQAALIAKAYEYGFPIFEHARLVYLYSYYSGNPQRVPVNSFGHRRRLVDHTARTVTTPNNDTLYSSAVIDLSGGPVKLDVPDFGARYYSIAFLDSYTNNFAYLGTRMQSGKGGAYLIVGPGWRDRPNASVQLIRAPSNHIIAIVRILIDGPADYDAVHRLQDALTLTPTAPTPARDELIRPVSGDAANFVAVINQVLRDNPPPAEDGATLKELAPVGIGPDAAPLTPAQRVLWTQNFAAVRAALISRQFGTQIQGWVYLPPDTGNFGTDYRARSIIALHGIWANIPAEMHYALAATDAAGAVLDGNRHYRLHLPAGAPPADGFWSISLYEVTKEGGLFFGDNPIHRYAIGDRTRGLVRNPDGSFDILIQKDSPGADRQANWLPIPAQNFALVARAYLPGPALLDGRFHYPGLEPVN